VCLIDQNDVGINEEPVMAEVIEAKTSAIGLKSAKLDRESGIRG